MKATKARERAMTAAATKDGWQPRGTGEWQLTDRLWRAGLLVSYSRGSTRYHATEMGKKWLEDVRPRRASSAGSEGR